MARIQSTSSAIAPQEEQPIVWHAFKTDDVCASQETDRKMGLSAAQVKERVDRFGLNELAGKTETSLLSVGYRSRAEGLLLIRSYLGC